MRNFTRGLLVGVGIGFLFAPLKGEQLRNLLAERFNEFRNSLPEDSSLHRYAHQIRESMESTKENLRGYAQQTVSKAIDTGSTLSNRAMQAGQEIAQKAAQTSQDMAQKAAQTSQDMAQKAKQTSQDMAQKTKHTTGSTSSSGSSTRITPESANAQPRE